MRRFSRMAKMYPPKPPDGILASERKVFECLSQLPDQWRVFHSVVWLVPKRDRQLDLEADFVLLHKDHGMVVLEVKGKGVFAEEGVWHRTDRNGDTTKLKQSPFDQVRNAMHDLKSLLENHVPNLNVLPATRAVVFPFASHPGSIGLSAPQEMILCSDEIQEIESSLGRLIKFSRQKANLSSEIIAAITKWLAPTAVMRAPRLGTALRDSEAELIELTEQQLNVLHAMRRNRQAVVFGSAGTGKTVLAVERARRLAAEGFRVLLTCYNRPLGDHLADQFNDEPLVTARSFHSLGRRLTAIAGIDHGESDPDWFSRTLPDLLPDAALASGFEVDAVIVDEGQDFPPNWFTALQLIMSDADDGPFYVFTDPAQNIFNTEWDSPLENASLFDLDTNCRNTRPIALKVGNVLNVSFNDRGAAGPAPSFVVASNPDRQRELLVEILEKMIEVEGLRPDQLAVLCDRRSLVDDLRRVRIGSNRLVEAGQPGIACETIHRFKGLETDVGIVLLTEVKDDRDRALAYIGMSRARLFLVTIGSKAVRSAINWSG